MQELDPRFMSDDRSLREDSNSSRWSKIICEASANCNRPVPYYHEDVRRFEKAGSIDVRRVYLKSPTKEGGKF